MTGSSAIATNPCVTCGACCAQFRVSFYWAEADALRIPEPFTQKLNDRFLCMQGTDHAAPRCVALMGEVGHDVSCRIYSQRPSPCREVQPGDTQCQTARAAWQLPALSAQDSTMKLKSPA